MSPPGRSWARIARTPRRGIHVMRSQSPFTAPVVRRHRGRRGHRVAPVVLAAALALLAVACSGTNAATTSAAGTTPAPNGTSAGASFATTAPSAGDVPDRFKGATSAMYEQDA